jgi:hypothetical protein
VISIASKWVALSAVVQSATIVGIGKNLVGRGEPHFAVEQDGGAAKALAEMIR